MTLAARVLEALAAVRAALFDNPPPQGPWPLEDEHDEREARLDAARDELRFRGFGPPE